MQKQTDHAKSGPTLPTFVDAKGSTLWLFAQYAKQRPDSELPHGYH